MDTLFGKRKPDGEVEEMGKEEMYGGKQDAPKPVEAKAMRGIMHEGKFIRDDVPGFEEAMKAASERAKTPEVGSVEIDAEYAAEVRDDARKRRAASEREKVRPQEPVLKAKIFGQEELAKTEQIVEAGIRRGEMAVEEALRDIELERSLADEAGLTALDAKKDILTRARDLFRRDDLGDSQVDRFNAIRADLQGLASKDADRAGASEAAAVIERAIEAMTKF